MRTFLHVTLPLSKQAILAGSVIVVLPMFGDYYTNDLLSESPTTSMVGNLIDSGSTARQVTQAASWSSCSRSCCCSRCSTTCTHEPRARVRAMTEDAGPPRRGGTTGRGADPSRGGGATRW